MVVNAKIRPRLTVSYDYNSRQFEKVMSAYKFLSETYNLIPKDLVEGLVTDRDLTAEFEKWEKRETPSPYIKVYPNGLPGNVSKQSLKFDSNK